VTIHSFIQSTVKEMMIGRVSSTTTSAANIMLPIGSLLAGIGSDAIGPVAMMVIAPAGFGLVAMYFWIQPSLRGLPSVARVDASHLGLDETTPRAER
jgi:MFS family permease